MKERNMSDMELDVNWLEESSDKALDQALATKEKVESAATGQGQYFYPKRDKSGNGKYIVRFLPSPPGEKDNLVNYKQHYFFGDNNGKKVREICPKSLSPTAPCPICEAVNPLFETGVAAERDMAMKRYAKKQYAANIIIIKDGIDPENNGKILTWCFGVKIYDKIMSALHPDPDDGIKSKNVFSLLASDGANFYINVKMVGGFPNYDDCKFGDPSAFLSGNKKEIMKMLDGKQIPSLTGFQGDDIKTYDELQNIYADFTNTPVGDTTPAATNEVGTDSGADTTPTPTTDDEDSFFDSLSTK